MNSNLTKSQIKTACDLFGGIKVTASLAGVDPSNLGKWLRGQATLSETKVATVLNAMGIPNGAPDMNHVHSWALSKINLDLSPAISIYFPNGAEVALLRNNDKNRQKTLSSAYKPEICLITDGSVRATLQLPLGTKLPKEIFGPSIKWRIPAFKSPGQNSSYDFGPSYVGISYSKDLKLIERPALDPFKNNRRAPLSINVFDRIWGKPPALDPKVKLLKAIDEENISYEEAIRRIRRGK